LGTSIIHFSLFVNSGNNKIKNKKYVTMCTVKKSHGKIITGSKWTPLAHIHEQSLSSDYLRVRILPVFNVQI